MSFLRQRVAKMKAGCKSTPQMFGSGLMIEDKSYSSFSGS